MASKAKGTRQGPQTGPSSRGSRRGLLLALFGLAALVAVAAVVGVVLANNSQSTSVRPASESSSGTVTSSSFSYLDGGTGSFADYRGTPLVVNFFASWCQPCLRELPAFAELHRQVSPRVEFLGLNLQDDPAAARGIIQRARVSYDVASDPSGALFQSFGGFAMPTTAFVTADGEVVEVFGGELTADQLEGKIEEHFGA